MRVEIFIKRSEGAFRKGGPFAVVKIRVEHHIVFVLYYESLRLSQHGWPCGPPDGRLSMM